MEGVQRWRIWTEYLNFFVLSLDEGYAQDTVWKTEMCQENLFSAFLEMHVSDLEVWNVLFFFFFFYFEPMFISYITIGIYSCLAMFGLKGTKVNANKHFRLPCSDLFVFVSLYFLKPVCALVFRFESPPHLATGL